MGFFSSTDTVDGKARRVLGDLSEDYSAFEILQTVDQKAGENVDPDDVVSKMRELDDDVDAKLAAIDGQDVDQKDMREAAGAIAERTDMSQAGAMQLLSSVVDAIEQMDPAEFSENFGQVVDEYYRGDVDQAAVADTTDSTMSETSESTTSSTDNSETGDNNGDVDQKQEDAMNPLDLVEEIGDGDARDTVENYAESVGKDPEDCAAEWVAENVPGISVEGYGGNDGGDEQPPADQAGGGHDQHGSGHDRNAGGYDQKLEDLNLNERIADAVTSDEVIDAMAGEVAQKMASDDEFVDGLVEEVDQKGDFVTTDETVVTAPSSDSKTVGESGAISGGDSE